MTVRAHVLAGLLGALLWAGCGTNIPDPPAGERISGTLTYTGTAQRSMTRPAARVLLFLDFPPSASPIAMLNIEQPDFDKPVPYELAWVSPKRYKVIAQLIDLSSPDTDVTTQPAGGYPDFCTLSRTDQGFVTISEDAPAKNVDITLYDLAGQTDPCNAPTTVCPLRGKATLSVVVRSSRVPTPADSLVFALFTKFPSTTPTSSRKIVGQDLTFPETILDNTLAPGTYSALYTCFDVGSNSGMGLCTSEDAYVLSMGTPITLVADQITNVAVDLDSSSLTVVSTDSAAAHGCP
jgi:hypothetical protein